MAQSGFTPIKLYLSTNAAAAPLAADLAPGELAINNNDGKLFYEDSSGVVQVIATKAGASGDVVGPASATDNAVARFDLTTGKIIQNSAVTIDDTGNVAGVGTLSASGQLTLTNASDYNLYASGVGANFMQGKLGIGSVAGVTVVNLLASNNATGNTGMRGIHVTSEVQSDVTDTYSGFDSVPTTAAAAFTLTTLNHFRASQGTIGAGSTVTNQYGFRAGETLTGATNNYGFYGNIASGTGRWNFYASGTAANVFVGTTSLGGAVGSESLRATPVASAVNYVEVLGGATGTGGRFFAAGSDTNITLDYVTKGTSAHNFYTGATSAIQFTVANTASAVNYLQLSGSSTGDAPYIYGTGSDTNVGIKFSGKGNGSLVFSTNTFAQTQFTVAHTASAVNYLQVTGAATGNSVSMLAQGTDAVVQVNIASKGAGGVILNPGNQGTPSLVAAYVASPVNYAVVYGSATGNAIQFGALGSDANIDLALTPKGTGVLKYGTYTAGIIAQAGYITIADAGGTTRRLLVG